MSQLSRLSVNISFLLLIQYQSASGRILWISFRGEHFPSFDSFRFVRRAMIVTGNGATVPPGGGGLAFIQPSNCSLKTNEIQEKKQVKIMKQTYLIGGNGNASRNRNTRTRKRTRHTVWPFQRQTARYVKTLASRNSN